MIKIDIVGAGLAGRLTILGLLSKWPSLDVKLIGSAERTSLQHTWCFHQGDLRPGTMQWIEPYVSKSWSQYEVRFPRLSRSIQGRYFAIRSEEFLDKTDQRLQSYRSEKPRDDADLTILATGWPVVSGAEKCGWQKFVGLDVTLEEPHKLATPVLMDAKIEQLDGFRFLYCLPWDTHQLLIEDTYYSSTSDMNIDDVIRRIYAYADAQSWKIKSIERKESGALPLGFSASPLATKNGTLAVGAASGYAHPVTGYTTSILFRQIEALTNSKSLDPQSLIEAHVNEQDSLDTNMAYFYLLNRMLFHAAAPAERYKVLERFYSMPESLISRFYAADLTAVDRIRILLGRPPVPFRLGMRELGYWIWETKK